MATKYLNNIIEITRGDFFVTEFDLNLGSPLFPEYAKALPTTKIYFGVMEPNQPFENALLRKSYDIENHVDISVDLATNEMRALTVQIVPEDTEKMLPGNYYYALKMFIPKTLTEPEKVFTIIPKTKFVVVD